jgi:predicted GNAT family acetyltransferase
MDVLDNPIWHSLNTHHANLALGDNFSRQYPESVTNLGGMPEFSPVAQASLLQHFADRKGLGLFLQKIPELSQGMAFVYQLKLNQMICEDLKPVNGQPFLELSLGDVDEMVALAKATAPGPFGPRTIELGNYIGIRNESGKLIAMAGERLQLDKFAEISAVCTDPAYRGKGLAKALVSEVAARIMRRGKTPFLHVLPTNESAIKSYLALGFKKRRDFDLCVVERSKESP